MKKVNTNTPEIIKEPILLSQKDAAAFLCKHPTWLERRRVNGDGPPFRYIGRTPVYEKSELIEWINNLPAFTNTAQASYMA